VRGIKDVMVEPQARKKVMKEGRRRRRNEEEEEPGRARE